MRNNVGEREIEILFIDITLLKYNFVSFHILFHIFNGRKRELKREEEGECRSDKLLRENLSPMLY